jgi:tripartite-type tricarboxylate transporter receptor subunit TctC
MRLLLTLLGAVASIALWASPGHAQSLPTQPIRLIVPYAPGGGGDTLARTLGEHVSRQLGQQVVVENRAGGGTLIGSQAAASAAPNGHTLLFVAASFIINPHLVSKMPFDPAADFTPVTLMASNPHVLVVHPSVPAANLREFVEWARSRKGGATFASFGNGSSGHLGFELLKKAAAFQMVHVPYKGVAPATTDLIGGQVDAMLTDLPLAVAHVQTGKLKAIAAASDRRVPTLPDVPTFSEAGLEGFTSKSWYGLVVRSGTPADAVSRLNAAFVAALRDAAVKEKLNAMGMDAIGSTAAEFERFMKDESARYGEAVRLSGARVD